MDAMAMQTISLAVMLGVGSSLLARWLKVPAVLFYLVCGFAAGPVGLHLLEPVALGHGLLVLVETGVAIILFEGGLSLSAHGFRAESAAIHRILFVTLPLTGLGAALLAHLLLPIPWRFAIFFGALIVVTGPTVIGSLLKSTSLNRRMEVILHWESIWGDVLGVLLSALALEMIRMSGPYATGSLASHFVLRIVSGAAIGTVSGFLLARVVIPWVVRLRDPLLPGVVAVAGALGTFFLSNTLLSSSGPLAVAVAGFSLSYLRAETLHEIRQFKEQLSSLFISMLFVLLCANIDPIPLAPLWPRMLLVALLLGALVRPLAVLVAFGGTTLSVAERLFIGLIGPRGIIAMATVSYASLVLTGGGYGMELLLNLTFAIIFFSGTAATLFGTPLARILRVLVPRAGSGILIAGANLFSNRLAEFASRYVPVLVLDRNTPACLLSGRLRAEEVCLDLLDSDVYEKAAEEGFQRLLANTGNDALNELIARQAAIHLEPDAIFRVPAGSADEQIIRHSSFPAHIAFAEHLHAPEAINGLANDTASLELMRPEQIGPGMVPLLEVAEAERGIRIVKAGEAVKGKALCYVPRNQVQPG